MSDPVETVLFDLDDTLCTYRRSGAELLSLAFDRVGVEPFFEVETYYGRYEGYVDDSGAYADERDHSNVDPLPGAVETVERLAGEYRLGLVTNGAPGMQRQKLDGLPFGDAFETVVYAGYEVPAKPAPEPFERALADLDAHPERAVHVGNSPSADVDGAHAAGLRAALLPDGPPTETAGEPDYVLDSLSDLTAPPWDAA
ncbi:haloacid dehalogenase [Halobacteriales archaeon SW_5_70_135]|nr:MAG: haloacid dehalogenase [Halobacteriales archaeon SW_5_70_135]